MGFSGWARRCPIVVQSSITTSDCTNFPLLLTHDTLPSEMFDADGSYPALNGGGDIRFSSDKAGDTRLSCEIELFSTDNNPANGKAAIWVKKTILAASNTTIYVWYGKAGESQPAASAAYGSEAVWVAAFEAVLHMNQDPSGGAPQMNDSTSNDKHTTSHGTMLTEDLVAGRYNKGLAFEGTDDFLGMPDITAGAAGTLSCWIKPEVEINAASTQGLFVANTAIDQSCMLIRWINSGGGADFFVNNAGWVNARTTTTTWTAGTWYYICATWDGTNIKILVNGVEEASELQGAPIDDVAVMRWACSGDGATPLYFRGIVSEIHRQSTNRSACWCLAEYKNQSAPATYVIEGTPELVGLYPQIIIC